MNKNIYTTILLGLLGLALTAQEAVLVSDYNPGEANSLSSGDVRKIFHNDLIYLPILNEAHGQELGIIREGELSLLADIFPGEGFSTPQNFIVFNDQVYFTARMSMDEAALFVTDGTEEGTLQVLESKNLNLNDIIYTESSSGWLYINYGGELIRINGTDIENLGNVSFRRNNNLNPSAAPHNSEMAFMEDNSGDLTITVVNPDGSFRQVLELDFQNTTELEAFYVLGDWFIYEIRDFISDNITGLYGFQEGDSEPIKISDAIFARGVQANENTLLRLIPQDGIYSLVANDNGLDYSLALDVDPVIFTQGSGNPYLVHKDQALFLGIDDFPFNKMLVTDVNTLETTEAFETQTANNTFIQHNNFGFIAGGIENNALPVIHYWDFQNQEAGRVIEFQDRSINGPSVIPLGVQENRLYFSSNLDTEVGRELYYVDVSNLMDLDVSVDDINETEWNIKFYASGFELVSDEIETFTYSIYDLSGRLIQNAEGTTNTELPLQSNYTGLIQLTLNKEGNSYSTLRHISKR